MVKPAPAVANGRCELVVKSFQKMCCDKPAAAAAAAAQVPPVPRAGACA